MTKASQVVVLVEDQRHQRFVLQYLKKHLHYENHQIRGLPLAGGHSSGEQFVRKRYAAEVQACRNRSARAETALIVAIDADTHKVETRHRQLRHELEEANLPARALHEAIVHLVPKRNIEAWILCLNGASVEEFTDYKSDPGIASSIPSAVTTLFAWSRLHASPAPHCVPSLIDAIPEIRRLS